MARCNHWDDDGVQCSEEGAQVVNGYCDQHRFVKPVDTPPVTGAQGTSKKLYNSKTAQTKYPKHGAGRDSTGGEFLVNGATGLHVHIYNDGGAHVKVGTAEIRFLLKPLYKLSQSSWDTGVAEVKRKCQDPLRQQLLDAMVWTLAEYAGLSDQALSELIWKLEGT
jgi:hypothetical protein